MGPAGSVILGHKSLYCGGGSHEKRDGCPHPDPAEAHCPQFRGAEPPDHGGVDQLHQSDRDLRQNHRVGQ